MVGTCVVTGGCGFIGSHLVDALLAEGEKVRVLDDLSTGRRENLDPASELIVGSVTDVPLVRDVMRGADVCFHLAAVVSVQRATEDWLGTHAINQSGTIAVFDAARRNGRTPVIYASSAAVYGDNGADHIDEDAFPRPLSAYGADKLGGEHHARVAWHVHGVPNTGLRFFNVYGPRQDSNSPYSGVIAIFAQRIAEGLPVIIHGDGRQVRDFVFVADVVESLLAARRAQPDHAPVYNVCTGRATSVLGLATLIGDIALRVPRLSYAPRRTGDIRRSVGDPRRAAVALGQRPRTIVDDGLRILLGREPRPLEGAMRAMHAREDAARRI